MAIIKTVFNDDLGPTQTPPAGSVFDTADPTSQEVGVVAYPAFNTSGAVCITSTPIPVPPIVPFPQPPPIQDTIRGGLQVFLTGQNIVNKSFDDTFELQNALDTTLWSDISSGTGETTPTRQGLVCESKFNSGSIAGIESTDVTWRDFHLRVEYDIIIDKKAEIPVDALDFAALEFISISGDIVRVSRSFLQIKNLPDQSIGSVIKGETELLSGTIFGSTIPVAEALSGTLELIRVDNQVFGFVDGVEVFNTKVFPLGAGTFRMSCRNLTNSTTIKTRFRNFTYRPHATIDGKLLDNKTTPFANRIIGNVPATSISRLGLRDIKIFGRFGVAVNVDGFEYILPDPKTITDISNADLRFYGDANIKD
jgi:hypothetical protein